MTREGAEDQEELLTSGPSVKEGSRVPVLVMGGSAACQPTSAVCVKMER